MAIAVVDRGGGRFELSGPEVIDLSGGRFDVSGTQVVDLGFGRFGVTVPTQYIPVLPITITTSQGPLITVTGRSS